MGEYAKKHESVMMKSGATEEDMRWIKKRKSHPDLAPAAFGFSDQDESSDVVNRSLIAPDLESEGIDDQTEILREATPARELCGDSEQVLLDSASTPKKKLSKPPGIPRREIPASVAEKMPSAAELEEFFAVAEEYEQKRFAEKYNYDVIKDVPLEGKYQWVRLHP